MTRGGRETDPEDDARRPYAEATHGSAAVLRTQWRGGRLRAKPPSVLEFRAVAQRLRAHRLQRYPGGCNTLPGFQPPSTERGRRTSLTGGVVGDRGYSGPPSVPPPRRADALDALQGRLRMGPEAGKRPFLWNFWGVTAGT